MVEGSFVSVALILALAVAAGAIAKLLRQPVVVSFIIVGILAGPTAFNLVEGAEEIRLFAKFGIAILLFLVGLKLDFHMIRSTGKVALVAGLSQVAFTAAVGFGIAMLFGFEATTAFYIAVALTFSSTIIIIKLIGDKRELDTLYGRIAVGILIVQDILVVAAMVVIVTIGTPGEGSVVTDLVVTLASSAVFLGVIAFASKFVLEKVLDWISKSPELTLLFGVAWAIVLAAISILIGLSMEIGAFVAGVSLASTAYRESLGARMVSLRDVMLLFFFIELGASLTFADALGQLWPAIVLSVFVLVGKPLIVFAIMGWMGYRSITSFRTGVALAQISEFSLILIALGYSLGQVDSAVLSLVTLVAVFTITVSSYLILYTDKLFPLMQGFMHLFERGKASAVDEESQSLSFDAIVIGSGRFGTEVISGLISSGSSVLAVDLDPDALARARELGAETLFGDVGDPDFAKMLPIHQTGTLICTAPDRSTNTLLLESLKSLDYGGELYLTALDNQTAEMFAKEDRVTTIRPLKMAANRIVKQLKGD
ncbi:MAG: cation:proton antiporter [Candidatus Aquiluna sp.]|jgi:Kef-type K+ transport system membrane component KefB|nr:cation:proton antiporter [Aquiluna sp.]